MKFFLAYECSSILVSMMEIHSDSAAYYVKYSQHRSLDSISYRRGKVLPVRFN